MPSIRGARNGFYYGSRLRFAHAFVMSTLFGRGTLKERFKWSFQMAFNHGKLLSLFVFTYKTVQSILNRILPSLVVFNSFIAGVLSSRVISSHLLNILTSIEQRVTAFCLQIIIARVKSCMNPITKN